MVILLSQNPRFQPLFKILLIIVHVCDEGRTHMCHSIHVEARGQLCGIISFPPPLYGFQESNLDHQVCMLSGCKPPKQCHQGPQPQFQSTSLSFLGVRFGCFMCVLCMCQKEVGVFICYWILLLLSIPHTTPVLGYRQEHNVCSRVKLGSAIGHCQSQ